MDAWIDAACARLASLVPYAPLQDPRWTFLHRALVGLLLVAPLCATAGIQVVNFRMAFFAEAIGHSAFTGLALGLLAATASSQAGFDPRVAMIGFGVAVALGVTLYRRSSGLPSDTVIGVFSAATMALGLCLIGFLISNNRVRGGGENLMNFLQGNILLVSSRDLVALAALFAATMGFQALAYNRLMFIGVNAALARTLGMNVRAYEYVFAAILALVVMFSIQLIGALLATAMLVIPAAAARNLAWSAASVFWWGIVISTTSAIGGLVLSDYLSTAAGATTVLCATAWFVVGGLTRGFKGSD